MRIQEDPGDRPLLVLRLDNKGDQPTVIACSVEVAGSKRNSVGVEVTVGPHDSEETSFRLDDVSAGSVTPEDVTLDCHSEG